MIGPKRIGLEAEHWQRRAEAAEARVMVLETALEKAVIRLAHLAGQIEAGFGISGTLRMEQAMKARHMSDEARAALQETTK
jgi:hypothetical protein